VPSSASSRPPLGRRSPQGQYPAARVWHRSGVCLPRRFSGFRGLR
jgi:hypothetical protein